VGRLEYQDGYLDVSRDGVDETAARNNGMNKRTRDLLGSRIGPGRTMRWVEALGLGGLARTEQNDGPLDVLLVTVCSGVWLLGHGQLLDVQVLAGSVCLSLYIFRIA
jgi:hypothetical protein